MRHRRQILLRALAAAWLALAARQAPAAFPSPDDWRDLNIYQIFTDRFYDGDPSNNNAQSDARYRPTDSRSIHGGDFKGIELKLDYLRSLGVNAIWISPIVLNVGGSAYHGYGAHNFYELSPPFGTMADLTNMVAAAHARGIYVIVDIVCNHQGDRISSRDSGYPAYKPSGYNLRWTRDTNRYPPPFNDLSYFHNYGNIGNYTDPEQILGELSGLDDLRTEDAYVRSNLVEIYKYWIREADVDGFRIDTVKHVEIGLWQHFNPAIRDYAASLGKTNFFQFGEVYDGSEQKCGYYTGTKAGGAYCQDSTLDFPLYYRADSVFALGTGNTKQIQDHYANIPANFAPAAQDRLVTFLDNHDVPRFLSAGKANNDTNRLVAALSFLYSSRGIPCLYYGTEQAFSGAGDPNNREDMFWGSFGSGPSANRDNFDFTHPLFRHVAQLNNFRRLYPSLTRGTHVNLWNNPSGPGLFAYARRLGGEEIVVVLNTATSTQTLAARPTTYAPGAVLVNLFNTNEILTVTSGNDGFPSVTMPGASAKMFIARHLWKPLDPVVEDQSPAHGSTNVVAGAPITLTFSQPMDAASVESAFSIQPLVAGSFSWSANQTEMTFAPSAGFGARTNRVRLAATAYSPESSNSFTASFETFFVASTAPVEDTVPPTVQLLTPPAGEQVSGGLLISGTASDNVGVDRVEVRLDNQAWVTAYGTESWSYPLDSESFLNGTHQIQARARDEAGNVSTTASATVRFFNIPADYVRRISAGNPSAVTNCDGQIWMADQEYTLGGFGYQGGSEGHIGDTIDNVCEQAQSLYQRERYSSNDSTSFRYLFDCPPGLYAIELLETETWVNEANARLFDIYIQGELAQEDCDIFTLAGGQRLPLSLTYTATVASARLEIEFRPKQVENARVSGVSVEKIADLDTDGDGIPDWWTLAYFDHATGQEGDSSRAGDDPDNDGLSNLHEFLAGTDPADPGSCLRINSLDHGAQPAFRFNTVSGRSYNIQATRELSKTNNWILLRQNIPGSDAPALFTDTNQPPFRFFRLQLDLY
jgi:glycosidase